MNFCEVILILKMEGKKQHFQCIMSRKVKMHLKSNKNICAVWGKGAVTDRMCQKWCAKFHAGDFSLHDAPQSGRPVGVDSDQIETLIEMSQHYTTWVIANIFKISKPITLLVKIIMCVFYFIEKTKWTF